MMEQKITKSMFRRIAIQMGYEKIEYGHWIEDDDGDGRHCSICGEDYCYLISNCELYNYCPHCGAKNGRGE